MVGMNPSYAYTISDAYQLLAKSLILPDMALAESIADGRFSGDVRAILNDLDVSESATDGIVSQFAELAKAKDARSLLHSLRIDYTTIFTHPQRPLISPYETSHVNDNREAAGRSVNRSLFVSASAADARFHYRRAGLEIDSKMSNEPADHIYYELEFMATLYMRLGKALDENNGPEYGIVSTELRDFIQMHVSRWFDKFFDDLKKTGSIFFGALGHFYSAVKNKVDCFQTTSKDTQ